MPAALAIGVAGVTLVYVATTAAFIYVVPIRQVTSAAAFAARAGEAMLGSPGPGGLAAIVVLSVVASLLALVIMAPRLYVAMSEDRLFPSVLGSVHPATRAPVRATIVLAALASVYVLAGTFQEILAFFMCSTLLFVALAAASLIVLRRRAPDAGPFHAPAYPLTPLSFIVLVAAVVVLITASRPVQAFAGFAVILLGLPAYGLLVQRRAGGRRVPTWIR
jgi:APA family basic amino acid/polyamine antiporter